MQALRAKARWERIKTIPSVPEAIRTTTGKATQEILGTHLRRLDTLNICRTTVAQAAMRKEQNPLREKFSNMVDQQHDLRIKADML